MSGTTRKLGRKSCNGYHLISVKDYGCSWEGILWVKVKSLKEYDALSEDEQNKRIIDGCPFQVPGMCFPTEYPYVRSECKMLDVEHELYDKEEGNCIFLFRYAVGGSYNCRLRVKNDKDRVYEGKEI